MLDNKKLALVHVAKNQLNLDDEEYRLILNSVCGYDSATEIRSQEDFKALMEAFKKLGFKYQRAYRKIEGKATGTLELITPEQMSFIKELWRKVTKHPDNWEVSLQNFLVNRFKVGALEKITRKKANDIIEALKEMSLRTALRTVFENMTDKALVENKLLGIYNDCLIRFDRFQAVAILACILYYSDVKPESYEEAAKLFSEKAMH